MEKPMAVRPGRGRPLQQPNTGTWRPKRAGTASFSSQVSDEPLRYLVYGTNANHRHELLLTLEKRKGGAAPDRAAAPWLEGYGELLGWTCFSIRRYTLSYVPSWSTSSAW